MATFLYRHGRKIPFPATVEIKQAFKLRSVMEAHRTSWAAEEGLPSNATWDEIVAVRSTRLAREQERPDAA